MLLGGSEENGRRTLSLRKQLDDQRQGPPNDAQPPETKALGADVQ